MKQGIIIDSPFGLYTLAQAKDDSRRNINSFQEKWWEKRNHSLKAKTLISIVFLMAWTALNAYATTT